MVGGTITNMKGFRGHTNILHIGVIFRNGVVISLQTELLAVFGCACLLKPMEWLC